MITIGIDPGLSGAIGVLKDGEFIGVFDMPIVAKGSGSVKNEVNPAALIEMLRGNTDATDSIVAALERVNAMPGQGSSSVFSLGDSFGTARACLAACRFETHYVAPVTWKKHFKLDSDKEKCRAFATRLFPAAPLGLKKHADRAESLLIARWLYEKNH
jgi:crossover junction endodeoxyribonuclease RuvC